MDMGYLVIVFRKCAGYVNMFSVKKNTIVISGLKKSSWNFVMIFKLKWVKKGLLIFSNKWLPVWLLRSPYFSLDIFSNNVRASPKHRLFATDIFQQR